MKLKTTGRRSSIDYGEPKGAVEVDGNIVMSRVQGQKMTMKTKTDELDIADAADITISTVTATASNWIPAGSYIVGVVARVTGLLTGAAANVSIGYTGATTVFANAKGSRLAVGSTFNSFVDGAATSAIIRNADTDLLFTSSSGTWTGGKILVTMFYYDLTAPQNTLGL